MNLGRKVLKWTRVREDGVMYTVQKFGKGVDEAAEGEQGRTACVPGCWGAE